MKKNNHQEMSDEALHPLCTGCDVFNHSIFAGYQSEEIIGLFPQKSAVRFSRNDVIYREGEKAQGLFCLFTGKVKLVKYGRENREYILRLTKPGDLLGLGIFNNYVYCNTAIALEDGQACFLSKDDFIKFARVNPNLAMRVMKILCEEIDTVERRISGICQKSARERVAEVLLALKSLYGLDHDEYVNILLSMRDLASYACTSSATLSRLLSEFRRRNFIQIKSHRIKLLNPEKLSQIAGVPQV